MVAENSFFNKKEFLGDVLLEAGSARRETDGLTYTGGLDVLSGSDTLAEC